MASEDRDVPDTITDRSIAGNIDLVPEYGGACSGTPPAGAAVTVLVTHWDGCGRSA
jgi:hypothetical protein